MSIFIYMICLEKESERDLMLLANDSIMIHIVHTVKFS